MTTSNEGIEYIWQAMTARYGSKWMSQWRTDAEVVAAKRIWAIDVGKTSRDAVEKAFYKMKDTHPSWPPTSAEFGLLCQGKFAEALGIPDFDLVYEDLMMGRYSEKSNMIYWGIIAKANERTPIAEMRMWSKKNSMNSVRRFYDECKKAMLFGVQFEPPKWVRERIEKNQLALEQTLSKADSDALLGKNLKETGNRFLSEMKKNLKHGAA